MYGRYPSHRAILDIRAAKSMRNQTTRRPLQKNVIARAAELERTTLTILADQTHFHLSPEKWDEFVAAVDAPSRNLPGLRELLAGPDVFDESEKSGSAR
jgi:uncharacterized protein (DUF1778 family)